MSEGSDFEDDVAEEEEEDAGVITEAGKLPENPLVQEMVPECLNLLCKIGNGLAHAYVRLDAHERDLTDIELLRKFIHVRYVDVSGNLLEDISPLNNLTHLLTLKADKNNLKTAKLDPLPYLQIMNLSGNKITSTEGVEHPLLEQLNLNSNLIPLVSGLNPKFLTNLTTLELRGNKLTTTAGIYLPNLKNLYLAGNSLKQVEDLDKLENLMILHLRDNQIDKLDGFTENMKKLQYINLRANNVSDLKELKKMVALPMLRALVLNDNPCLEEDGYRMEVLIVLRKLERLDKDEYTEDERVEAEDLYEQRRQEELMKSEEQEEIADEG
uniref:Leucine-rich repeat-containing protein 23 n=2 Tax=Ciona intestinalis TaxID=7719 RepID=Q8T896_CIOIN|nr:axonemal leucine-rich repeat protein [Ciona intestinalis]BAB85845.1 axonemal leucine-rich repeat protein [Ciona intestinalis]|eukprot:NP_001027749.1 axonemal leucine-rich repeat protein [Ciona intestinalis]